MVIVGGGWYWAEIKCQFCCLVCTHECDDKIEALNNILYLLTIAIDYQIPIDFRWKEPLPHIGFWGQNQIIWFVGGHYVRGAQQFYT
jgi:hypothetical protein